MRHAHTLSNRVAQLNKANLLGSQLQNRSSLAAVRDNDSNSDAVAAILSHHNNSGQITPQILHFILQLTVQSHDPDFAASMLNYSTHECSQQHTSHTEAEECVGSHNSFEALFHPFSYMR